MRLFISYAHTDIEQVKLVVEILRSSGHEPWFDHRLLPGQDWQTELLKAIRACEAFVYVLSPASINAEWCQWEFAQAVALDKPVVPILLKVVANLPKEISRFHYADFSDDSVPFLSNGIAIARFLGGLTHLDSYRVMETPDVPDKPNGIPSQLKLYNPSSRVVEIGTLPNLLEILPPPFAWCEIPAGWVTLDDRSKYSGTRGGKTHVKRFWMGKYPITNSQYQFFENDPDGYMKLDWWSYSEDALKWLENNSVPKGRAFREDELPRTRVTWYETIAFCNWLSAQLGQKVILPTEEQWQRAAQGDDDRKYPWGDNFDSNLCNSSQSSFRQPTRVTHYSATPSPYGVLDLSGNVWDWCLTRWSSGDSILGSDNRRVTKGGSWRSGKEGVKVSVRDSLVPQSDMDDVGFRLIWSQGH